MLNNNYVVRYFRENLESRKLAGTVMLAGAGHVYINAGTRCESKRLNDHSIWFTLARSKIQSDVIPVLCYAADGTTYKIYQERCPSG